MAVVCTAVGITGTALFGMYDPQVTQNMGVIGAFVLLGCLIWAIGSRVGKRGR